MCNSAELREAYEACLPALSEFSTELGQNPRLFAAYQALAESPAAAGFDNAQKTILGHALRDFRLSGIDLPAAGQQRYGEIQMRLSELTSRFANQVLDATQAWTRHLTDEAALAGLTDPEPGSGERWDAGQVWAYDFVFDTCADGRSLNYTLSGTVDAGPEDGKARSYKVERKSALSPVPGLPGVLR